MKSTDFFFLITPNKSGQKRNKPRHSTRMELFFAKNNKSIYSSEINPFEDFLF
ncbi:hypothetical protein BN1221_02329c [Brenneria goodwinii]|uniref:Uncharacterized protein n=1 Tax=Brenneria goodwinii TaxID=1109412 RepID=A0A0G4JVI2_9GAMM|nr:hypothetical protein BN1221_02329c [Brenneria goodwinii]